MKCKQCGWENPDSYDRCQKCNNVLSRPRTDEMQASGYEAEHTVIDRTSVRYGGSYPGGEYNQSYNGRPYNNQQYYPQPNNARPYNNQPTYNDIPASQPQQPVSPGYDRQPYGYPQQSLYGAMPVQPQYAPQPEVCTDEHYCPECDAELPAGATECPVCHTKIVTETIVVVEGVCPDCGTEVTPAQKFCHNCGAPLPAKGKNMVETRQPMQAAQPEPPVQPEYPEQPEQPEKYMSGTEECPSDLEEATSPYGSDDSDDTVDAGPLSGQIPGCELRMVDGTGAELRTVCCTGIEVELYRGNTDPANNTIARDMQAKLTYADGKWCIEDCSTLQTTFIRPSRKMELHDGDIIVMGNREFIFKS